MDMDIQLEEIDCMMDHLVEFLSDDHRVMDSYGVYAVQVALL